MKPEKKLDHAWMVYAPSRREPNEPDAAQMCEALIAVLLSHPQWRRPSTTESNSTPVAHSGEARTNNHVEPSESSGAPETNPSGSSASRRCPESSGSNHQEPNASSSTRPSDSSSQNNGASDHPNDFLTTDAARSFLRDKDNSHEDLEEGATSSTYAMMGRDNNNINQDALDRQISDIVVLETIAQALNGIGEPTSHTSAPHHDQSLRENLPDDIHG